MYCCLWLIDGVTLGATFALRRFRIQGTSGDQVFQGTMSVLRGRMMKQHDGIEALRKRPINRGNARAMKYCFLEKAHEHAVPAPPAPIAPNYSVATTRVRKLGKSVSVSVLQPDSFDPLPIASTDAPPRRGLGVPASEWRAPNHP